VLQLQLFGARGCGNKSEENEIYVFDNLKPDIEEKP
jgi:hypothetical protein